MADEPTSRSMGVPGATMARPMPSAQSPTPPPPLPPPLPGMMMMMNASAPSSSSSGSMSMTVTGTQSGSAPSASSSSSSMSTSSSRMGPPPPPPPPPPMPSLSPFHAMDQTTSPEVTAPVGAASMKQSLAPHQQLFMQQFMGPRYTSPSSSSSSSSAFPIRPPMNRSATSSAPSSSSNPLLFQDQSQPPVVRSATLSTPGSLYASLQPGASPPRSTTLGSPPRTSRPGLRLSGDYVEYTPCHDTQEQQTRALEVSPVTIYKWGERPCNMGTLIAVNDHFISYPIRKGLIRVISQSSVNRILLREHENYAVQELAFFDSSTNLLLSMGTNDQVIIWQLDPNNATQRDVWKRIQCTAQRAIWHPTKVDQLALLQGSVLYLVDLTQVDAHGIEAHQVAAKSIVCGQASEMTTLNDVAFSPCGSSVVTGGSNGRVNVYRVRDIATGQQAPCVHRFEPFEDHVAVQSVHFFSGNFTSEPGLLCGGNGNVRLALWNAPLEETSVPVCYQTVSLLASGTHELVVDATGHFIVLADRKTPLLYVFHLAPSPNAHTPRRVDNVTEFRLGYPILSMAVRNRGLNAPAASMDGTAALDFAMHLYCVQTQAIQRYNIPATSCYAAPPTPGNGHGLNDETGSITSMDSMTGSGGYMAQSVGAITTEEEQSEMSRQAAAESPGAGVTASTPETEIDIQMPSPEDTMRGRRSPSHSPRISRVTTSIQEDGTGSYMGDDIRSYPRSSPTSSVRACQDESSVHYEPSLDDTISDTSQQTWLGYLRRMEDMQSQRDAELKEQMRVMMGNLGNHLTMQVHTQVEKAVQKQIQTVLVPAMGRIVLHTMENNFMKPVQTSFQRVITEKLLPEVEFKLQTKLDEVIPGQMDSSVGEMVNRVVEDVRQPVRESFRECFQDIIIPSFQAATQKMFEQINDSFVKGTRAALEGHTQAGPPSELQQLVDMVGQLSAKVDQMAVSSANYTSTDEVVANGSNEAQQVEMHKKKVQQAVDAKDFEEAFKLALGAQSVDLVAFTCKQCDSRVVLSSRPPQLSQMLILCLVQQLGADLADDLALKLTWLRESLLVMNVRDPAISGFVISVLQELQSSLNLVPAEERDSQYMLLHHILNSMLNSA